MDPIGLDKKSHIGTALAWFCALILAGTDPSEARTWHIHPGGGGDAPTIQAGIDSAVTGDSLVVSPGFYDENIDMRAKALVLHGSGGAEVTVIDGGQRGRVLAMSGGAVDGFTLQRGACDLCDGGGILIFPPGPAAIRNCIIQSNIAGFAPERGTGGGVFNAADGTVVENSILRANFGGEAGGGLYDYAIGTIVRGNAFIGNSTSHGGGGIVAAGTVIDNLFFDNQTETGGGGIHADGAVAIRSNTVVGNRGSVAGILALGAVVSHNIVALNQGTGVVFNGPVFPDCNDIWGNSPNVGGWSGTGNGNISADPLFCSLQQQNFRLHRQSPCLPEQNAECGLIGAFGAGCGTTAVISRSWSSVKSVFR